MQKSHKPEFIHQWLVAMTIATVVFSAGCENGQLIENAAQIDPDVIEREAMIVRRTLPEELESVELRRIAKELAAKQIEHPQLDAMLRELDAIESTRRRQAAARAAQARAAANSARSATNTNAENRAVLEAKLAQCGIDQPKLISKLGSADVSPAGIADKALAKQLSAWERAIQVVSKNILGQKIVKFHSLGTYACRTINREPTRQLSRHAFGMAIDISGFTLADGTTIRVDGYAKADDKVKAFLRAVDKQSCQFFSTSLGPMDDRAHANHFHLDMKFSSAGKLKTCSG